MKRKAGGREGEERGREEEIVGQALGYKGSKSFQQREHKMMTQH